MLEPRPQVLDDLFARAALRGERILALTRLVLALLFGAQMLIFRALHGESLWRPEVLASCSGYAVGIAFSVYVLRARHLARRLERHLYLSVLVDAVLIGAAALPFYVVPGAHYQGFLLTGQLGIVTLATVASGFRLVPRVALVGAGAQLAVQGLAFAIDLTLNAGRVAWGAEHVVIWAFSLLGGAALAYSGATWPRRLVAHGADAAVAAERARQHLGVYVSEEVAREALDVSRLVIGGSRQQVAVLFSDLRGFTSYSEHASPEQVVLELNAYLNAMVCVVRARGGFVDKFVGDSIMVVFGIPKARPDDSLRAILTARDMQEALEQHNLARARGGRPPLRQGIGVHYGPAVAGNIGNEERLQYTVIGDVVNLASRLEDATKALGVSVVISAAAVEAASAADGEMPPVRPLGPFRVKGRDAEIEGFTLA